MSDCVPIPDSTRTELETNESLPACIQCIGNGTPLLETFDELFLEIKRIIPQGCITETDESHFPATGKKL